MTQVKMCRLEVVRVFRFNRLFPCVLVDAHGKKAVEQVNPTFTTCTSPSRVGFVVAAAGGAFADCAANSSQAPVCVQFSAQTRCLSLLAKRFVCLILPQQRSNQ
jgi:hypothetical protein